MSPVQGPRSATKERNGRLVKLGISLPKVLFVCFMFAPAIPCGVCNICGAPLGRHFALRKGARFIRPMMLTVMVLLIKLETDLLV